MITESILPDILEVAHRHDLVFNPRPVGGRPDEKRANCPFCVKPDRHYHLYINTDKKTFKCYRCGNTGGVAKFMAMLTGKTEQQVLEELKQEAKKDAPPRPGKPSHPAFGLTAVQLRMIGLEPRYTWSEWWQDDRVFKKWWLNEVWTRWKKVEAYETEWCMVFLYISLWEGQYQKGVEVIKARSAETGINLLDRCLKAFSAASPPKWVVRARIRAFTIYELEKTKQKDYPATG